MRIMIASVVFGDRGRKGQSRYEAMREAAERDLDEGGSEILPSWHHDQHLRREFIAEVRARAAGRNVARSYVMQSFTKPNDAYLFGLAACMEQRGAAMRDQRAAVVDFLKAHWDALTVKERAHFLEQDRRIIQDWTVRQKPESSAPRKTTAWTYVILPFGLAGLVMMLGVLVMAVQPANNDMPSSQHDSTINISEDQGSDAITIEQPSASENMMVGPEAYDAGYVNEATIDEGPADPLSGPSQSVAFTDIEKAVGDAVATYSKSGIAGARATSKICHEALASRPSWSGADKCVAFDLAIRRIDGGASVSGGTSQDAYFKFRAANPGDAYAEAQYRSYESIQRVSQIRDAIPDATDEAVSVRSQQQEVTLPDDEDAASNVTNVTVEKTLSRAYEQ